jgi:hypothetical protein
MGLSLTQASCLQPCCCLQHNSLTTHTSFRSSRSLRPGAGFVSLSTLFCLWFLPTHFFLSFRACFPARSPAFVLNSSFVVFLSHACALSHYTRDLKTVGANACKAEVQVAQKGVLWCTNQTKASSQGRTKHMRRATVLSEGSETLSERRRTWCLTRPAMEHKAQNRTIPRKKGSLQTALTLSVGDTVRHSMPGKCVQAAPLFRIDSTTRSTS